ncbi:MAG: polA [Clostridiales bacterium]|jgi:DNA polymerase-1|nr:polA [Clostridiales bacterium]
MKNKIVLVDGNSILNRAFYGLPLLSNSEGLHTNAVYGFLNILFKILDEEKPTNLAIAFDLKAPTFRHLKFKEYKGTRKSMPDELREQVPIIKEVLQAMKIKMYGIEGYEADDILGTLAKQAEKEGFDVSVISGDKDLLQLATDIIKIRIPKTKSTGTEVEDYYAKDVFDKYGVTPIQFIDLKGLMGDPSDNIPGVSGIGEKTAAKIISQYESIENAYKNIEELMPKKAAEKLKAEYDIALLSKELATIKLDCEIPGTLSETSYSDEFDENVYDIFKRLELKNLLKRVNVAVAKPKEEVSFKVISITNLQDLDLMITKAKLAPVVAIKVFTNYEIDAVAVCIKENEAYVVIKNDVISKNNIKTASEEIYNLAKNIVTLELKNQMKFVDVKDRDSIFDSNIAAYLINPNKDAYKYDELARDYLDLIIQSKEELLGKTPLESLMDISVSEDYYANVIDVIYKTYFVLHNRLEESKMLDLFQDIEMPLVFVLDYMEKQGIKVDAGALKEYSNSLNERILELEKIIYELAGEKFNINSPKQLGDILFEKLQLQSGKKTKTGFSTNQEVLEKLFDKHIIIPNIMEYRQLTKLKSTYADGLANYINPEDSRIHGTFNQTIAATGRISSTEPNLQNIPIRLELGRLIRKVFVPENDYIFVDADYSQIELRVLAHISSDETLIEAYRHEDDIHRLTASQVFNTPLEEVTSQQRRDAKAVNFGIVYGIGAFSLSQDLSITRKEAEKYINQYFKTYPMIKAFLDEAVELAKETGYSITLFGRRRPINELKSSNFMQRSFGERIAMNSPIQGAAADIMKIAMIKVKKRIEKENLKSKLILQVHDELLIETHKDEIEIIKTILEEEMKNAVQLKVPLDIDISVGNTWYETK